MTFLSTNFFDFFVNDFKFSIVEHYLLFVILCLFTFSILYSTSSKYTYPLLITPLLYLIIFSLCGAIILLYSSNVSSAVFFYNLFIIDDFTFFMKILVLFSAIVCFFISSNYLYEEKINSFEYFILLFIVIFSLLLIISSYDLLSMYLTIELQSLSLYILAAYKRNSAFSTESGLKYFILGAFSSGLLLFGCSLVYGFSGVTSFEDLAKLFINYGFVTSVSNNAIVVGLIFIAVALLFKLTAAPFHMWAPDVYEGAPTAVTAFFAIVPKIAIFSLLIRLFFYIFYDFIGFWQQIFILSSILSMVIGSLGALYQTKVKRLFAYSSIGHIGYLLIGLASGTLESFEGILLYLFIYIIMTVILFTVILNIREQKTNSKIKYITHFASFIKVNPLIAVTVMLTFFSMAGIPPLAGFCGKFYLFFSAISAEMYFLAVLGVLTSVISAFYYIRIIKILYFVTPSGWFSYKQMNYISSLILAYSTLFLMFFFCNPVPFLKNLHNIVLTLCL